MGWPNAIYCDNASYFVHGVFSEELKEKKVLLFPAPVIHPSSVGLAEKYVHLTMTALRTLLRGEKVGAELPLDQWDECLASAVFAINNRVLRVQGFTPAQLLMGFIPKGHTEDFVLRDDLLRASGILESKLIEWVNDCGQEQWEPKEELAKIEDRVWDRLNSVESNRQEAVGNLARHQEILERNWSQRMVIGKAPETGDLTLLRRFVVDKEKGRKLEPRWEGPYLVKKFGKSGVSVTLVQFITDRRKGIYSLNSVKTYVYQEKNENREGQEEVDLSSIRGSRDRATNLEK